MMSPELATNVPGTVADVPGMSRRFDVPGMSPELWGVWGVFSFRRHGGFKPPMSPIFIKSLNSIDTLNAPGDNGNSALGGPVPYVPWLSRGNVPGTCPRNVPGIALHVEHLA
jgi:hypothetical protein